LEHRTHGQTIRLKARPRPSQDERLTCDLLDLPPKAPRLDDFDCRYLEISDGRNSLKVELGHPELSDDTLKAHLPEVCEEQSSRQHLRQPCPGIEAQVLQNGTVFNGTLADYSSVAFRLELQARPPQTFHWLNSQEPMTISLQRDGQTILAISGQILRRHGDRQSQTIVVSPSRLEQKRFPAKSHRARRVSLKPSPVMTFVHPLTGRQQRLEVIDLSGSGFAVREEATEAGLLPGMILNELQLTLADTLSLDCSAQVVYQQRPEDAKEGTICCGLALLDMPVKDHNRLMNLLHQADNRQQLVCPQVDLDRLWEFFFRSGFLYPKKYQAIQENRAEFQDAYTKLYQGCPRIARHFVLQERNQILGHMAMLRLYSNSWLIHHHAADRQQSRQAGLEILKLVGEAVNEAKALYSAHMASVMCYFRPENRFPQRMFGGVATHYDDPSRCSIDSFAYFHYRKEFDLIWKDGGSWELSPAQNDDFAELYAWYQHNSGGLMLQALDLCPELPDLDDLQDGYKEAGFQREHHIFALKREGRMLAVFQVLKTEVGLNLSNLSNALTVIVLDQEKLPREAFFTAVSMLASKYPSEEVPVMVYPHLYPEQLGVDVEKTYNLWVLDGQDLDPYFDFCETYFRRMRRNKEESPP
jgi:hypothetical protein